MGASEGLSIGGVYPVPAARSSLAGFVDRMVPQMAAPQMAEYSENGEEIVGRGPIPVIRVPRCDREVIKRNCRAPPS